MLSFAGHTFLLEYLYQQQSRRRTGENPLSFAAKLYGN